MLNGSRWDPAPCLEAEKWSMYWNLQNPALLEAVACRIEREIYTTPQREPHHTDPVNLHRATAEPVMGEPFGVSRTCD